MITIVTPLPRVARLTRLERLTIAAGRALSALGAHLVDMQLQRIARRAVGAPSPAARHREAVIERIRDNTAQVSPLGLR